MWFLHLGRCRAICVLQGVYLSPLTVYCSVLQCVAVFGSVLQYLNDENGGDAFIAVCCSVLQCVASCRSVLQCVVVCCSVLQCVAVCCSVLQCVAVCCSVEHLTEKNGGDAFILVGVC